MVVTQPKTITEASLRRYLKLVDADGISSLPNTEIFEQLALMGMLVQGPIQQGEGSTVPVESHHTPITTPSTSQPPLSSPSRVPTPPHDSPLLGGHTPGSDEGSMTLNELTLIMRVKKLEHKVKSKQPRRRARVVISDTEKDLDDPSKQGRRIAEIDQNTSISLILLDQEEPTELVEDLGSGKKGEKEISTANISVSTASATLEVSTAAENLVKKDLGMKKLLDCKNILMKKKIRIARDTEIAKQLQEEFDRARQEQEVVAEADQAHDIDWSDPAVLRYHALQNRSFSVAEQPAEGEKEKKNDDSQQQAGSSKKRSREDSDEDNAKKKKLKDDAEKEELRDSMDVVSRDDIAIDVESLATKYLIVDWKTHVLTENMMYYQIIKADGSSKNYKIFSEMLDDFDRQDVMDLHRLVKERYDTTSPEGYDLLLWGDLKILFEPNEEDEIWKNHRQPKTLISWRLFDSCGIHILLMHTGIAIHMMIEKKYPLTQEMLSRMLRRRLEVFKNGVENQLGKTINALRSDRGGEYISQEFKDYLKACGIVQQLTPPFTPQHNSVSERRNHTLLDMVRSMMNLTTLSLSFRGYALESATRILNMVPTKKVDKTPYELWYRKVPNLSYLKDTQRKQWVTIFTSHLKIKLLLQDTSPSEITSEIPIEVECFKPPQEEVILIHRSKRTHRAPTHLESNKWLDAMNAEMQSMIDNIVWVLVDLPPNFKTVGSKWIYKKKSDMDGIVHTYKARLVAKGYTQLYEVDYEETFSPVADIRAIRILISIAVFYDYEICLLSVKDYLGKCFAMKDLGEATFILGIKIYKDWSKRLIGLSQSAYMDKILKRYKMDNSKRGHISMQERLDLYKTQGASTPEEVKHMQNVPYVSTNPGEPHWTAVKNILKYLRNTKDMFSVYDGNPEAELRVDCYCDAGFENDRDDIRSQTGYVFILNGGAVDWKSSKQSTTAMSAIEAEYIAASEAVMKARGAKHYHRRYHYVNECIELGEINLLKVHTDDNLADHFMKALPKEKLTQHASSIGLRTSSRQLWDICEQYGQVFDSFIPSRASKDGKIFGFVRFIKVKSLEVLVGNLNTIWIGKFKLRFNVARFQHGAKNDEVNVKNQTHLPKVHTSHSTNYSKSYVAVVSKELPHKQAGQTFNDKPVMVIGEECFANKNLDFTLVAKVNNFDSMPNLLVICKEEGFENLTIRYLGGFWVSLDFPDSHVRDQFQKHTGILSWFSLIQPWSSEFRVEDRVIWVDVEGIPFVAWTHNTFKKISSKVSMIRAREIIGWNPEFILDDNISSSEGEDSEDICSGVQGQKDVNLFNEENHIVNNEAKSDDPFNIYGLLNRPIKEMDKEKGISDDPSKPSGFTNVVEDVNNENSKGDTEVNGVECPRANNSVTQEGARSVEENHHSKLNNGRHHMASNSGVDSSLPKGQCPRIDSSLLEKMNEFVEIGQAMGFTMEACEQDIANLTVGNSGGVLCVWDRASFTKINVSISDYFVLVKGVWNASKSNLLMIGVYAPQEDARKMSKLDIYLVSEGILCQFPGLSGFILSKHLSDHRPIMLKETSTDYGPIPFKLYHSWLSNKSFEQLVVEFWKQEDVIDTNDMSRFKKKLQLLKHEIKSWVHQNRDLDNAKRKDVVKNLESIDKQIVQHGGLEDLLTSRMDLWKKLTDIDVNNGKDLAQKAKVKWPIEGDENSKFFHDADGAKQVFLQHFASLSSLDDRAQIHYNNEVVFPTTLSFDQNLLLEEEVTNLEIKKAVWDCGSNKSPGPDGYTFEFIRKF
ncbi:retrotransposon protein, putative, ty1-copia subclass [Tanacetum coccineum]